MTMTVKPLRALTQLPSNSSSANPKSGKSFTESPEPPHSIDNYEPHSKHRAEHSKHYHQEVVGTTDTGQFGDRAVEQLNPTTAAPAVRSFPGLANG